MFEFSRHTCIVLLRGNLLLWLSLFLVGCTTVPVLRAPNILLLGEVHDNPDGHQQRYEYLLRLIEGGWRPALVMEQFDRENQGALTTAQKACPDADCVIRSAGGKRWDWPHYSPLVELALRYHLPLIAANISRAEAASVMKSGLPAALDLEIIAMYGLTMPLPAEVLNGQRVAIETGHCGKVPEFLAQGMVSAQVARDVWMAHALRTNAKTGAVLIAGNGHVRCDIGVPHWLSVVGVKGVQTHGFIEQGPESAELNYDVTHSITVHQRPDPCGDMVLQSKPSL
ncbi:ChaN family lipoprotein [Rhodoferax sp.]|uniref:ChaN family lipoprotein n=1 Tax=Rhodoferax sp. TaxID=50421 RepID=UPI002ACECA0A|nr:ChaN family lipoprotein [Rhodoferax sp.]MDZ7920565.1 ChaN family lipoprotein [Rhodoferax sp.]